MLNLLPSPSFAPVYDNSLDAYNPELWANESLAILEENMVMGNLVHRDFSNQVARFGHVVHTRKPGSFKAKRKTNSDSVTIQDASATDIAVPLNQHLHTSFMIMDGEDSYSFKDLTNEFLRPAVISMARAVDLILSGQAVRFKKNRAGGLNQLSSNNAANYLIDARQVMNTNKAPDDSRNMVLTTVSESQMLKNDKFTNANQVGDAGTALRTASLGQKLGWNLFMAQNQPYVTIGNTTVTGAINAASTPPGSTSLTVDGFAAAISAGSWITVEGDMTPLQVVSTTGGSTPTAIVVAAPGLMNAVADNAVVTVYSPGAVNYTSGYAAGYAKEITVDGFSVAPQIGQPVTFASNNDNIYTIIDTNGSTGITLDRPLVIGLSDNDKVNIGPAGSYNFGFQRNALALVTRPLALPRQGTGALAANVNYNNLSMRVVMTYDGERQGTLVTFDMLAGVAMLDDSLGVLLLG